MASIAQRLVTLCATLGEFPHIRFAADGGGRTEGVARTFQVGVVVSCGLLPLLPKYFTLAVSACRVRRCSLRLAIYEAPGMCFLKEVLTLVDETTDEPCLLPVGRRWTE